MFKSSVFFLILERYIKWYQRDSSSRYRHQTSQGVRGWLNRHK